MRTGVLLVHGLNGSLQDMHECDEQLQDAGFLTRRPLLAGHGTNLKELLPLGWDDWLKGLEEEFLALRAECDEVFLMGHSLGGALCLQLASKYEIAGIITLCAPIRMPVWMYPLVNLTYSWLPVVPTIREDLRDPEARKRYMRGNYRGFPVPAIKRLLDELPRLRETLPNITAPALVLGAKSDHVVPARDALEIYQLLGSSEKTMHIFKRSYHILMKDCERDDVYSMVLRFLERHRQQQAH